MKHPFRLLGVAVLTVLLCLIFTEVLLRLVAPCPYFKRINISGDGDHMLSENPNLVYVPRPNTRLFNSDGYRGPAFPRDRVPGRIRILLLGDSVLEGLGVGTGQRFGDILAGRLGSGYEVINLGVQGYNILQETEYLKEKGLSYRPDYVVFFITYNDLSMHSGEIMEFNKKLEGDPRKTFLTDYYSREGLGLRTLLHRSQIYLYMRTILYGFSKPASHLDTFVSYELRDEEILALLSRTKELSKTHDFRPAYVLLPTRQPEMYPRLKSLIVAEGLHYFDLDEVADQKLSPERKAALFYPRDPCHFTPEGNAVIAELLRANIAGILKDFSGGHP